MGILSWIVLGLVAGALAKLIMPGEQGGGIIVTIILGIIGALVGGFLGTYVFGFGDISGFDVRSIAIAVGGALVAAGGLRFCRSRPHLIPYDRGSPEPVFVIRPYEDGWPGQDAPAELMPSSPGSRPE